MKLRTYATSFHAIGFYALALCSVSVACGRRVNDGVNDDNMPIPDAFTDAAPPDAMKQDEPLVYPDAAPPVLNCAPMEIVRTAQPTEAYAFINRIPTWGFRRVDSIDMTPTIVFSMDTVLEASKINLNLPDCADSGSGSCKEIRFAVAPGVTGVGFSNDGSKSVSIASGTKIRFAKMVQGGGFSPYREPFIMIFRACQDEINACEFGNDPKLCRSMNLCFSADSYCSACDKRSAAYCVCHPGSGNASPDGTACSYAASDDVIESGVCTAGTCTPTR